MEIKIRKIGNLANVEVVVGGTAIDAGTFDCNDRVYLIEELQAAIDDLSVM